VTNGRPPKFASLIALTILIIWRARFFNGVSTA
jgi:hypothetical protein